MRKVFQVWQLLTRPLQHPCQRGAVAGVYFDRQHGAASRRKLGQSIGRQGARARCDHQQAAALAHKAVAVLKAQALQMWG